MRYVEQIKILSKNHIILTVTGPNCPDLTPFGTDSLI